MTTMPAWLSKEIFLNGHPSSCQTRPTRLNFGVLLWASRTNPPRYNMIALQASVAYDDITLPPHHYVRVRQPPAWSLTTERISQQIIHVLRFPVIRSIIILVHANIYSLSLAVRLKRNGWLTASKCRLECKNDKELKHARFWDPDGNRKRTFHMPGQWCLPDFCTNNL